MSKSRGKLTDAKVIQIRKLLRANKGVTQTKLAVRFGVSNVAIHFAAVGKTFAHVKSPRPLPISR